MVHLTISPHCQLKIKLRYYCISCHQDHLRPEDLNPFSVEALTVDIVATPLMKAWHVFENIILHPPL